MRVLILGAGASKSAGYPTADALMGEVGKYALAQPWAAPGARSAWERWLELRGGELKEIDFLLSNPNPEIVLSALDLYVSAFGAVRDVEWPLTRRRRSLATLSNKDALRRKQALQIEGTKRVLAARTRVRPHHEARQWIIESLHEFFQSLHALDARDDETSRYRYLRELLSQLRLHDVVITFNWDALAERVLAALGMWTPIDGYGLDRRRLRYRDRPIAGPKHSAVKVLKLHGSVGWYASREGDRRGGILIDGWVFLRQLGIKCDNEPIHVLNADPDEDYHWLLRDYWDRPLIVYPTFLKTVVTGEFGELWQQAADVLSRADQVDIYGYSLPASDGAARVLLNVLRRRLTFHGPRVHVHDPSEVARRRWREFLGRQAKITGDRLG